MTRALMPASKQQHLHISLSSCGIVHTLRSLAELALVAATVLFSTHVNGVGVVKLRSKSCCSSSSSSSVLLQRVLASTLAAAAATHQHCLLAHHALGVCFKHDRYDDVVNFLDPITKYSNVQGYMFNIRMLKGVFDPLFELHDIKQTAQYEITTRWTMTMKVSRRVVLLFCYCLHAAAVCVL
jgi:hypothetical protein